MSTETKEDVLSRLERIEGLLTKLVGQPAVKENYTLPEFAKIVGRSVSRVRKWCQEGRIVGTRRGTLRGEYGEWQVSHEELVRYQNHGLLNSAAARR